MVCFIGSYMVFVINSVDLLLVFHNAKKKFIPHYAGNTRTMFVNTIHTKEHICSKHNYFVHLCFVFH